MKRLPGFFGLRGLHAVGRVPSKTRAGKPVASPRVLAQIIATLTILVFTQPTLGASLVSPSNWTLSDTLRGLQPIALSLDGWLPSGDAAGSCDATRSRVAGFGTQTLTLTSSGTPCGKTQSLGVSLQDGRLNVVANLSLTQATASLSNAFSIALQYGVTDSLKVGFQEVTGVETNLWNPLGMVFTPAMMPLFGPVTSSPDAALSQFSVEYNSGAWLARTALLAGSGFTLQEIEIQNRIAPNWTADVVVERATTGADTFDAGQFTLSSRVGDVSVSVNYMRGTVVDAFAPDIGFVPAFTLATDTPSLSVSLPSWGWQWTLYAIGGSSGGFTLTAQRSSITVTLSGEPLGVWLTQSRQF